MDGFFHSQTAADACLLRYAPEPPFHPSGKRLDTTSARHAPQGLPTGLPLQNPL